MRSSLGGGVILLVEDDESVRCLARRIFERGGYTVLQAPNGRAALELAASRESTVDVVLSDVIMPEMGGVELKERLRAMYPALQVNLTSGYSEADLRGRGSRKSAAFLRKPFTAPSLLQVVAETMAGKPQPADPRLCAQNRTSGEAPSRTDQPTVHRAGATCPFNASFPAFPRLPDAPFRS